MASNGDSGNLLPIGGSADGVTFPSGGLDDAMWRETPRPGSWDAYRAASCTTCWNPSQHDGEMKNTLVITSNIDDICE